MYIDGTSIGSTTSDSFYENTQLNLVIGGQLSINLINKISGFIKSSLNKWRGIYTSNFTPPTNELTVTSNTVFFGCQSSGNVLQEATGKTMIAYR